MLKNQKGSTLVMVMIIASILILLSITLNFITVNEAKQSIYQEKKTKAYYIARSGAVATAQWITNIDEDEIKVFRSIDFPIHSSPIDFGEGSFEVEIDKKNNKIIITSIGKVHKGNNECISDNVTLVINEKEAEGNNLDFKYAAFANMEMDIGNANVQGNIGTNSEKNAIKVKNKEQVKGNIFYDCNIDYPLPILPNFPERLSIIEKTPKKITSDIWLEELSNKDILVIDARTKDISIRVKKLNNKGMIKVIGDNKVSVFVEDSINLGGDSSIKGNNGQIIIYYKGNEELKLKGDQDISLYVENADIKITGNTPIHGNIVSGGKNIKYNEKSFKGLIYAPNAEISFNGVDKIEGIVVGNTVKIAGKCELIYDSSFGNKLPIIIDDSSNYNYEIDHWE